MSDRMKEVEIGNNLQRFFFLLNRWFFWIFKAGLNSQGRKRSPRCKTGAPVTVGFRFPAVFVAGVGPTSDAVGCAVSYLFLNIFTLSFFFLKKYIDLSTGIWFFKFSYFSGSLRFKKKNL